MDGGSEEWTETIEPRVWHWLCTMAVKADLGTVPALQIKSVTVPKGWTIVMDARNPHAGAPAGELGGLRVHVYGVESAIDKHNMQEQVRHVIVSMVRLP